MSDTAIILYLDKNSIDIINANRFILEQTRLGLAPLVSIATLGQISLDRIDINIPSRYIFFDITTPTGGVLSLDLINDIVTIVALAIGVLVFLFASMGIGLIVIAGAAIYSYATGAGVQVDRNQTIRSITENPNLTPEQKQRAIEALEEAWKPTGLEQWLPWIIVGAIIIMGIYYLPKLAERPIARRMKAM